MSQKHKAAHLAGKILDDLFSRSKFTFRGATIDTPEEHQACSTALSLLFLVWFDLLGYDIQRFQRILGTWSNAVSPIPIDIVEKVLSECDELILACYAEDRMCSYTCLLQQLRTISPLAGAIIAPIRTLLISALSAPMVEAFARVHQATSMVRVTLSTANLALDPIMVDDWLDTDIFVYDPEAPKLRPFFRRHFQYFSIEDAVGCHGPGSVAEYRGHQPWDRKYLAMGHDEYTEYLIRHMHQTPPFYQDVPFLRTARLVCVPKSVNKRRVITIEPATLVWYQHAIQDRIDQMIKENKHLRRHIAFDHQEYNAELALEGSWDGSFSTLDLSKASDSVTLEGLRACLPAAMFTALYSVRAHSVELPDGSSYRMNKYAGMGNACTFRIESLYFAAIVEQGILEAKGDPKASRYRVYGDDIIVETEYVTSVIQCLERHGFSLNHRKSFYSKPRFIFRESCGMEAMNGCDVTPVRLSRGFLGFVRRPGAIQAAIELSNAFKGRYESARLYCIDWLMKLPTHLRPILTQDGIGVHVASPSNCHLYSKYRFSWQETVFRHGSVKAIFDTRELYECDESILHSQSIYKSPFSEYIRYYEYLRVVRSRQSLLWPDDRVTSDYQVPKTIIWGSSTDPDR